MRIIVIGGGIGGAAATLALRRAGHEASFYERSPEPREVGAGISLWSNAAKALRAVGADARVLGAGDPLKLAEIATDRGDVLSRFEIEPLDRRAGAPSVVIHRADLLRGILDQIPESACHFGCEFTGFEEPNAHIVAKFRDGREVEADLLVAADGLHSTARRQLHGEHRPRYSGYTSWRGVCTFPLADAPRGQAREVWGRGKRFGITRLGADAELARAGRGRVYWFACVNVPEGSRFEDGREFLRRQFEGWCDPIPALIDATDPRDLIQTDIMDRPPAGSRTPRESWLSPGGRVVLLGDAAHPTTPNLGQGACLAIEDGVVLARHLGRHADPEEALRAYEAARFKRAAPVVRASYTLGRLGQLQNPVLCGIRNLFARVMPKRMSVRSHLAVVGAEV